MTDGPVADRASTLGSAARGVTAAAADTTILPGLGKGAPLAEQRVSQARTGGTAIEPGVFTSAEPSIAVRA